MEHDNDGLINALIADLQPVRPLRRAEGSALVLVAVVLTGLIELAINGLADNVRDGTVSPMFLLANGLLLLLGIAASASTIAMASPRVGNRHDGPGWAMAMAGVFPVATVILLAVHHADWPHLLDVAQGWHCFVEATLTSLLIAGALLFWLRRGAPVSPRTAGLHLGVGAAALGTAVFGMSCPVDSIYHLGIWHALPLALGALAGRFLVPTLLRW